METDQWDVDPDEREEVRRLSAQLTVDLHYDQDQVLARGEIADVGFDAHRLFGNSTTSSIAELFPNLRELQIHIDFPNARPGRYNAPRRWKRKVELYLVVTDLTKRSWEYKDRDVTGSIRTMMAYTCLQYIGESFYIGTLEAQES
ncbi:hypothetical protein LTR85_004786 [Meristemomyces frigidus]|nr:hypothetical protein LTR85_004786 [Meristemomyces frigidus]